MVTGLYLRVPPAEVYHSLAFLFRWEVMCSVLTVCRIPDHKTEGTRLRALESFDEQIDQPPAVTEGFAFVGSNSQEITAVSLDDRSLIWQRSASAYQGISTGPNTIVTAGESLPNESLAGLAAFDQSDVSALGTPD